MTVNLRLSKNEAEILLNWHSIQKKKYQRYGSAEYIFPQEEWLINNLKNHPEEKVFDEMDLEIFIDWMHQATQPLPGNNPVYFPEENSLIIKLRSAEKNITKEDHILDGNNSARIIEYHTEEYKRNKFKDFWTKINLKIKHILKNSMLRY